MSENREKALAHYRIERARELIEVSERLLEEGYLKDSINRSYYAIFDALRAQLALEGFDSKKHSGIIAEFQKLYIKTGRYPKVFSDYIKSAFEIRSRSDYDDMYIATRIEAETQIEHAKALVAAIEIHL
ncbi:MAG: HEPN domain-containing protein [Coriobacteriales bacterium]|jgi:uncharacterized protein (UPF0332 family)|nr:HEPN domain-containing protein [Coriobacteriales bacterium]